MQKLFQLDSLPEFLQPRYNIAPFQRVPAATLDTDGATRQLRMYRWGLTRSWAADADGFFEWMRDQPGKHPPAVLTGAGVTSAACPSARSR